MLNPRICAAMILKEVIFDKKSLAPTLKLANKSEQSNLTKELCFGVCRYYFQLKAILFQLMPKPIKVKEAEIECLLLLGIYELLYLNTAKHAVVSEIVECTKVLKKLWATKLVNAILRNFLRNQTHLIEGSTKNCEAEYNHPEWIIKKIQQAYPSEWQTILKANNQQALMILRINPLKITTENYQRLLQDKGIAAHLSEHCLHALVLESACSVANLPRFSEGFCSVQDVNAQLAATFLQLQPGLSVLDACAAPGGKTTQLLETEPKLHAVIAVDHDQERVKSIYENLTRLQLSAKVIAADALELNTWWDNTLFDRILLDAPCSSTGVIRRHPDIKLLRQEKDIYNLAKTQRELLQTLWKILKPNGLLLYVTCSIFPEENSENIDWFLQNTADAQLVTLPLQSNHANIGLQLLPGEYDGDGFYFALLRKKCLISASSAGETP